MDRRHTRAAEWALSSWIKGPLNDIECVYRSESCDIRPIGTASQMLLQSFVAPLTPISWDCKKKLLAFHQAREPLLRNLEFWHIWFLAFASYGRTWNLSSRVVSCCCGNPELKWTWRLLMTEIEEPDDEYSITFKNVWQMKTASYSSQAKRGVSSSIIALGVVPGLRSFLLW